MRIYILTLALATLLSSCKKDEDPTPDPTSGTAKNRLTMDFANYVGDEKLVLTNGIYTNQDGDDFTVSKMIYFISNIKLTMADGTEYIHPGYHRISESDEESLSLDMPNIPNGTYVSVSFMIGIDHVTNVAALSNGTLTSNDEMYLNENAGHIMVNMEGFSPASHQPNNKLVFHIGGSTGSTNVVKPVSFLFPQELVVNNDVKHVRLKTDLLKMFGPDYVVDFSMLSAIYVPGDNANVIAHNYKSMITLTAVGD